MKKFFSFLVVMVLPLLVVGQNKANEALVKKTADFVVTGDGSSPNWHNAGWITIPHRSGNGSSMVTRAKILYSPAGMYFLFECPDRKLTSTMEADFLDLWKEDVVEVFLWTDEKVPVYFEYEISPKNFELPLLISNENGELLRWMPFHYEENRKTQHKTSITGKEGSMKWMAEFFIPYKLLRPLENNIPQSGTRWRANMYRVDYDYDERNSWTWQPVTKNFHDYERFGTFVFE
jgi:hypothetical protein